MKVTLLHPHLSRASSPVDTTSFRSRPSTRHSDIRSSMPSFASFREGGLPLTKAHGRRCPLIGPVPYHYSAFESLQTNLQDFLRCSGGQRDSAVVALLHECGKGRILFWIYSRGVKLEGPCQSSCCSPPQNSLRSQPQKSEQTIKWTSPYPGIIILRSSDLLYCDSCAYVEK